MKAIAPNFAVQVIVWVEHEEAVLVSAVKSAGKWLRTVTEY